MKKSLFVGLTILIILGIFYFFIESSFYKSGFSQIIEKSGINSGVSGNGGVSMRDYDTDGFLDLLVKNKTGFGLFRNNKDDTFTDVTRNTNLVFDGSSISAVFGDYDNDGCPDLYLANSMGDVQTDKLYHNNCDGTFTDVTKISGIHGLHHARGVAWGDYNNDGFIDIYVATYGNPKFTKTDSSWEVVDWGFESNILYRNNRNGTFTNVTKQAGVEGVAMCKQYETILHSTEEQLRADKNNSFFPKYLQPIENLSKKYKAKATWQPIWFDYDNDGLLDLYISSETNINALFHNSGDGTFTDVTEKSGLCIFHSTHGVAIGDYDNNGYMDLYVAGGHRNLLLQNNGNGTFVEVSSKAGVANFDSLGWGAGFIDYNNDGLLDLYAINGWTTNTAYKNSYPKRYDRLYQNNGQGKFVDVTKKQGIFGDDSRQAGAFGDFNNDGFTDIFLVSDISNQTVANRFYKNTPNGNHWLTVKLVGTESNRDGVGAAITVEVDDNKQMRQVVSGSSLLSQDSLWQTFGLGEHKIVDKLIVNWPSGIVQILKNIKSNQILIVQEKR